MGLIWVHDGARYPSNLIPMAHLMWEDNLASTSVKAGTKHSTLCRASSNNRFRLEETLIHNKNIVIHDEVAAGQIGQYRFRCQSCCDVAVFWITTYILTDCEMAQTYVPKGRAHFPAAYEGRKTYP